jgi:hypothetical protein
MDGFIVLLEGGGGVVVVVVAVVCWDDDGIDTLLMAWKKPIVHTEASQILDRGVGSFAVKKRFRPVQGDTVSDNDSLVFG